MGLAVTGIEEARTQLARARLRAMDLRPFLAGELPQLRSLCLESFASRTSPMGDAWPPPKRGESTAADLIGSLELDFDAQGMRVALIDPRAIFFCFGTRHQPARNFLPFDEVGGELVPAERGAAGVWWRGHADRLQRYLQGMA